MYVLPKKMCAYVNNNPHVETWKMLSSFNNIIHLYEAVELMLEIRIVSTECSCMSYTRLIPFVSLFPQLGELGKYFYPHAGGAQR